jgi:hypothetical protein
MLCLSYTCAAMAREKFSLVSAVSLDAFVEEGW